MNKRDILTAVCALALCPAFAQTSEAVEEKVEYSTDKYKVETNRFWDNWFISAVDSSFRGSDAVGHGAVEKDGIQYDP